MDYLNEGDMARFGHEISIFFNKERLEQYDSFREGRCFVIEHKDSNFIVYFYYQGSLFKYDNIIDDMDIIDEEPIKIFINTAFVIYFDINDFLSKPQKFLSGTIMFYYIQHDIIFYRFVNTDELEDMRREKFTSFLKELICINICNSPVSHFEFYSIERRIIEEIIKGKDNTFWGSFPQNSISQTQGVRTLDDPASIS